MFTNTLITLEDIFKNIDDLPWDYGVYIPLNTKGDSVFFGDMQCMILYLEKTEDPDDVPVQAKENGLRLALHVADFQSIFRNLKEQVDCLRGKDHRTLDLALFIKALEYYYDNDAYIDLEEGE